MNLVEDDIMSEQDAYIKNEVVDFIITPLNIDDLISGTSYQLIDTSDSYIYCAQQYFFKLYKKQNRKNP